MSQYIVRDDEEYRVVVGWDRPLQSYFAQVFEQGECILWEGAGDRIAAAGTVEVLVRPYVQLDDETLSRLVSDKEG